MIAEHPLTLPAQRRRATPYGAALLARGVVMLVFYLILLTGCVLDDEISVRKQLADWVALGDTRYFHSQRECTAAIFRTKARSVKSRINRARSIETGLRFIRDGKPVAFRVDGMTPADIHKELDLANRTAGIGMLTSGLGARNCLTPDLSDAFAVALQGQDVIVLYDPGNHAFALFERASKRVFYARGDVG